MKKYFPHYFMQHIFWILIFLSIFCSGANLSLANGIGLFLSLDGNGDEVRVEHAQSLVMTDTLTIEAWINPLGTGSGWGYTDDDGGIIVNKEGEYELARFHDGSIQFAVSNEDPGWTWTDTGFVVPEGTWAHLAFTYSASENLMQLFANGVQVFSTAGMGEIGDVYEEHNYFKIGGRREEAAQYFDGLIDEVRLWNIVRTESEIQAAMNTSLQGNESGLAGYWNFEDGAKDGSPNGNDGILIGQAVIIKDLVSLGFSSLPSDSILPGDGFKLDVLVEGVANFAGYSLEITFSPKVLQVDSVTEGGFLKGSAGSFFQEGTIDNNAGRITGISGLALGTDGVDGTGVLFTVNFEAKAAGEGTLGLREAALAMADGTRIPYELMTVQIVVKENYDVNRDGQVNILDLTLVAQNIGSANPALSADVNADGVVNIFDLLVVSQHLGESGVQEAPNGLVRHGAVLNAETVQKWIDMAHAADDGSLLFQLGIANLERLLQAMLPDKTALLANYPNPFNPETWIPYHLAHAADVTLTIYDMKGVVVRQFSLGYQPAGYYTNRTKAAYWDGRNNLGESVGSGVYFYQLQVENSRSETPTDDFSATRKMVILK